MTIYKFYCKRSKLTTLASDDKTYEIYAITNSRKLAKKFKKTRDMKTCFKCVECTNESDDEWETLKSEYRNHAIVMYKLSAFTTENTNTHKSESLEDLFNRGVLTERFIELPITMDEKLQLEDATESFVGLFPDGLGNPMLFKREIHDALHTLKYMAFYRVLSSSMPVDDDALAEIDRVYSGEEYDYPALIIDELQVFVDMFGELMRVE